MARTRNYDEHEFMSECLQAGQLRRYGDTWHKYKVVDLADEPRDRDAVLEFCMTHVCKSHKRSDMPHPFAPEMVECRQTLQGNGQAYWLYSVRELYTG